jgi:hypothetical protein
VGGPTLVLLISFSSAPRRGASFDFAASNFFALSRFQSSRR